MLSWPAPVQYAGLPQAPLQGLIVGRQRLGINLMSLIVTLREEYRLPIRGSQQ